MTRYIHTSSAAVLCVLSLLSMPGAWVRTNAAMALESEVAGSDPRTGSTESMPDAVASQVPNHISFQALLTDDGGIPLPGPAVDLEFNIYATDGTLIEGPIIITNVPITDGVVNVPVAVSSASFNGAARELGVTIDGGVEMTPRILLTSVPYALHTRGISVDAAGNVGIGGSSAAKLHVRGRSWNEATLLLGQNLGYPGGYFQRLSFEPKWPASVGADPAYSINSVFSGPNGDTPTPLLLNTAGGNVGIGTDDPQAMLHVAGMASVDILKITGGADLSEQFDIRRNKDDVKPGSVVCIDPRSSGKLVVSSRAYDRTVAGVVSGAGGVKPGMLMGQTGSVADGQYAVALTGRVYVWSDASNGPIQPGNLLTTSDTPGHAMKVTDNALAQGAIIGKAMTSLESGKGMVLVLVALQ